MYSQITLPISCNVSTHINTVDATIGYTYNLILESNLDCTSSIIYTLDVNTFSIPDKVTLYFEDTIKIGWIGTCSLIQDSTCIYGFYNNIYNNISIQPQPPLDFNLFTPHVDGSLRIVFKSQLSQIKVKIETHPIDKSSVSVALMCPTINPTSYYDTTFTCEKTLSITDTILLPNCDTFFIDSLYKGDIGIIFDTIYIQGPNTTYNDTIWLSNNWNCEVPRIITYISYDKWAYIPNTITPNNDGVNDIFKIYPREGCYVEIIEIYDRWGNKLFRGLEWAPIDIIPGTYIYVAILKINNKTVKIAGDINIII